jgi:hypothetical protein
MPQENMYQEMLDAGYYFYRQDNPDIKGKPHVIYRAYHAKNRILKSFVRFEYDEKGERISKTKVPTYQSNDDIGKKCFLHHIILDSPKTIMQNAGYEIKDVTGDGNCFYHAVAEIINSNAAMLSEVKKSLPQSSHSTISADDLKKLNEHTDQTWATDEHIKRLAQKIKLKIAVYVGNEENGNLHKEIYDLSGGFTTVSGVDDKYEKNIINIYNIAGRHFEAVTKKQGKKELSFKQYISTFFFKEAGNIPEGKEFECKLNKKVEDKRKKPTTAKEEEEMQHICIESDTTSLFGQAIQAFHDNRKIEFPTYLIRSNAEQQEFMETFKNRHNNSITTTKQGNDLTLFKNTKGENIVTQVKRADDNTMEFKDIKKSCTIMVKHSSGNGFDILAFNDKGNLINHQCVGNIKHSRVSQSWLKEQSGTLVIEGSGSLDAATIKKDQEKAAQTQQPFRYEKKQPAPVTLFGKISKVVFDSVSPTKHAAGVAASQRSQGTQAGRTK